MRPALPLQSRDGLRLTYWILFQRMSLIRVPVRRMDERK